MTSCCQQRARESVTHVVPGVPGLDHYAGSAGQLAGGAHAARRSVTNLSELGAEKSPESASRFRPPPESLEALLSHKLQARCPLRW